MLFFRGLGAVVVVAVIVVLVVVVVVIVVAVIVVVVVVVVAVHQKDLIGAEARQTNEGPKASGETNS